LSEFRLVLSDTGNGQFGWTRVMFTSGETQARSVSASDGSWAVQNRNGRCHIGSRL